MTLYLRSALMVCFVLFGLMSCKKKENSDPITLSYERVGNVVTLKWSSVDESELSGYYITRIDSFSTVKVFTTGRNVTTLVDTLPYTPVVSYSVVATLGSVQGRVHQSNVVRVTRPDVALAGIQPWDALLDKTARQLYVYSKDGNMQVYDVSTSQWVRSAAWGSGVGYCDIGVYNGVTELYVPREDGWLFIYDAATLAQVDQVNVGTELSSVNYSNGILYICGKVSSSSDYSILSYSRQSKTKIAQLNVSDQYRLKLVPGTNAEFLAQNFYYHFARFVFNDSGKAVSQNHGTLTGTYPKPSIFEVFPDGSKMISGDEGLIYGADLAYQTVLPRGADSYTSFCFDNGGTLVYASCREKKIYAYATSDWQKVKTLTTYGVPFKAFFNNGSILCVSTAPNPGSGSYGSLSYTTFIERL